MSFNPTQRVRAALGAATQQVTAAVGTAVRWLRGLAKPAFTPSRAFRRYTVVTACLTYLLIVMGGVVRVTGSGLGCGDTDQWPLCRGQLLPPLQQTALIEFGHRWIGAVTFVAILGLVAWTAVVYRRSRFLVRGLSAVVPLYLLQAILGAITVFFNLPPGIIMAHLANALVLLALLIWIAAYTNMAGSVRPQPAGDVMRLAVVAGAGTYLLALSGAFVVANGAGAGCTSWPLCGNGFQLSSGQLAEINMFHRLVAGVVVLVLGYVLVRLRRALPGDVALRRASVAVALLVLAQVVAGAVMVDLHLPPAVQAIHLALASALWGTVVLTIAITRGTGEGVRDSASRIAPRARVEAAPS